MCKRLMDGQEIELEGKMGGKQEENTLPNFARGIDEGNR